MPINNFVNTTTPLLDLLKSTKEGKTQLPDFQRSWVWNDEQIRSIIASISLSYPVGVVMMLQTGNRDVRFQHRPIEGVTFSNSVEPERLILDGQQRLTSLVQALLSGQPVITKNARGKKILRWYYIDIAKALESKIEREGALVSNIEREEAIISLPQDKIIRNFRGQVLADYSTPDKEYENGLFPVAQIFDCSSWRQAHNQFWKYALDKSQLFDEFEKEAIEPFKQYQVPVITLLNETPREAVCQVFEKVNTGGVTLTVFELLTATFASEEFKLREDWENREISLKQHKVLKNIHNTEFLQAVTLLATREKAIKDGIPSDNAPAISCNRREILKLTLEEYKTWAYKVTKGFVKAAEFLHELKIFDARDLPYQPQLTALAAIYAALDTHADHAGVKKYLQRWYWCGVFGEIYGGSTDSRIAKDLAEVLAWINGGSEPDTIINANFAPARLLSLSRRSSAAYKGLSALLMCEGGRDFYSGDTIDTSKFFDQNIDIHHIFPKAWCKEQKIDQKRWDCIVNKTPISAKTNRMIGAKAPSKYLPSIQVKGMVEISQQDLDEILRSHVIDPATLRADDFNAFFQAREKALLERIEKAMGKKLIPVVAQSDKSDDTEQDEYDEDTDNDDD